MIWREFFGLDEESGLKDLRRAYSKKIKACRPEDDQEYFMEIRGRYEEGCAYFENADRRPSFSMDEDDYRSDRDENENIREESQKDDEERIEYDEENTIKAEISIEENEREYENENSRSYEESNTVSFDIEETEDLEEKLSPYESCYEKLFDLYSDFNRRFDPESWRKLFFGLNFEEDDVFEMVFEKFIEENFALPKEAVQIIIGRGFVLSEKCRRSLDIVERSSFAYGVYPDISYYECEEFFKLRIKIYSWLEGWGECISKEEVERAQDLAVRDDETFRIFLYYMLQNRMDDLIGKYLEGISKEDAVEKGFLAFSAQMDFDKGDNSSSFEKYKSLMDAHEDDLRYEIGAFASGTALRYAGDDVEVPYKSSQCVFKIFSKGRKKIDKMKSRGLKKSVTREFSSPILAILLGMAAFIIFGTGIIMLFTITISPPERLESFGRFKGIARTVAIIMRFIIATGVLTGIWRWIRGKKRDK